MKHFWPFSVLLALALLVGALTPLSVQPIVAAEQGKVYYVAPTGDDNNAGDAAHPWQTIQHAANTLQPGDTVYVRGGVYPETVSVTVSGSADGGYITFSGYNNETPALDGSGFNSPDGDVGFYINSQSYLIIQGFEIRNYSTTTPDAVPMAIQIEGASQHIKLLNNTIHHIESNAPVDAERLGADAHGIAVYGNSITPVSHLLIEGNELAHLKLGSSEALALNGNVEIFTVTNNLIHDVNNIAIVAIGFEETAPQTKLDRARNGVIISNTVYNVDSLFNPSYGGDETTGGGDRSADGIYVDGGRDILIERNRVYSANIGIEIASEHGNGSAVNITARSNFIFHSHTVGISIGGYDEERGYAADCAIINNTLYHNDVDHSGSGELAFQFDVRNSVIKNNIFYANAQNQFISNDFTQNSGNTVDYNLYYAPDGAENSQWAWKDQTYTGFSAWRSATGSDAHSVFTNPQLTSLTLPNLHLQNTSLAIDAGYNSAPVGNYDIDGQPRVYSSAVDLGADEVHPVGGYPIYLPIILKTGGGSVARSDGAVKLTRDSPKSAQNPVFSPDGEFIVYTRFLNGYNIGPSELVKVRVDGSNAQIIVPAADADNVNVPYGSWVGNKICFSSDRAGQADEIWQVSDDGSHLSQLTTHSEDEEIYYIEPVFNPQDANLIAFEYVQGEDDRSAIHRIALLEVDSGSVTLLTDGTFDDRLPGWSNDGSSLLFQRNQYGQDEGWQIYVANIDAKTAQLSNLRTVSRGDSDDTDCSWSYDDQYILSSSNFGDLPTPNIFMFPLDAAQSPLQKTFNTSNEDGAPAQSHNGQWIAFESHYGEDEDAPSEIWLIKTH